MIESMSALAGRAPMGWWDLVDIAIVGFLIYEFLTLIRGTRAAQMALGVSLIVVLFYVSRLAPLQTVNWLIRNMIGYVVLGRRFLNVRRDLDTVPHLAVDLHHQSNRLFRGQLLVPLGEPLLMDTVRVAGALP